MILSQRSQRDLQRLLDDHVLAGPGGGHGRLQVRTAGRADRDDVDRRDRPACVRRS